MDLVGVITAFTDFKANSIAISCSCYLSPLYRKRRAGVNPQIAPATISSPKFPLPQTLLFLTVFERRLPIVTNPLSVDKFYAARKYFHLIGSG